MGREADSAARLLAKNGELVTIQFPGSPSYDPITGAAAAVQAATSVSANGYPAAYTSANIDGTVIRQNDIRLLLELISPRPIRGCLAVVDGVTYQVLDVQAIRKEAADVMFICQIRAS
ncbi:hypothetical protein UFOVP166_8 [uncultured Caudovirales phage]|uniref:Uncharacterized protein n=1 Tax=uncultured Caudovirales phage TaxID=2100421 RepID=A0A6J7WGL1_9CAUD|nr:hypothetical protein UFOVP166_8 [uncultured Caudovirales phage]